MVGSGLFVAVLWATLDRLRATIAPIEVPQNQLLAFHGVPPLDTLFSPLQVFAWLPPWNGYDPLRFVTPYVLDVRTLMTYLFAGSMLVAALRVNRRDTISSVRLVRSLVASFLGAPAFVAVTVVLSKVLVNPEARYGMSLIPFMAAVLASFVKGRIGIVLLWFFALLSLTIVVGSMVVASPGPTMADSTEVRGLRGAPPTARVSVDCAASSTCRRRTGGTCAGSSSDSFSTSAAGSVATSTHLDGHGVGVDHNVDSVEHRSEPRVARLHPRRVPASEFARPGRFDSLLRRTCSSTSSGMTRSNSCDLSAVRAARRTSRVICPQRAGIAATPPTSPYLDGPALTLLGQQCGVRVRRRAVVPVPASRRARVHVQRDTCRHGDGDEARP